MPPSPQEMAHPSQELHIVALLSTERGRRSAMFSSVQCLLSVVGSMGIILLFAGIPQLIYSPEVTVTNVVTFLSGALLLSVMVAGNACIGYKFRAEIDEIRGVLRESHSPGVMADDKPPSYDELGFVGDALPPDYFSVVRANKTLRGESSTLVEVVPTHVGRRPLRSSSWTSNNTEDNLQRLVQPDVSDSQSSQSPKHGSAMAQQRVSATTHRDESLAAPRLVLPVLPRVLTSNATAGSIAAQSTSKQNRTKNATASEENTYSQTRRKATRSVSSNERNSGSFLPPTYDSLSYLVNESPSGMQPNYLVPREQEYSEDSSRPNRSSSLSEPRRTSLSEEAMRLV